MSVISFKKQKLKKNEVDFKSIGALQGTLKYVTKKSIPTVEEKSVMIYTTDTAELFIGGGVGEPLKRLSDIIVVDNVNDLPEVGIKEKLYVSAADKIIYFWSDADGFQQVGGGTGGGGSVIQTKIMEYPAAAEFPAEGQPKAIYVAKDTDFLYRFDIDTAKYIQLARQATDPTISAKFNAIDNALADKAAKTDLSGYRTKADKVFETDLDPAVTAKLNTNLAPYDDSALKSRVSGLETSKADKAALDGYRKKTDAVVEADLDTGLKNKLNSIPAQYDDSAVKSDVASLKLNKADKSDLLGYRKNSIKITEADLDSAMQSKLNTAAAGYDDTAVKADIAALKTGSATKAEVAAATADVLKKTDQIGETNLAPEVMSKLNAAAAGYDDTAIKGRVSAVETNKADMTYTEATYLKKTDKITQAQLPTELTKKVSTIETDLASKANKTDLDGYRKSSEKITEADLGNEIVSKLNLAAAGYDDAPLKTEIEALKNNSAILKTDTDALKTETAALKDAAATKAELVAATAGLLKTTDKISESNLDPSLVSKINEAGYDDSAVKADIQALKTDSATKADLTAATADCLKSTDKIDEAKLTPEVVAKLNKASEVYDDTAIKTDLTALKEEKANKTDLEHYRRTNVAIAESDLETALAEKINKAAPYDDTLVKNDISTLQSVKADKTELSKYRETSKAIDISDLAPTVVDKINSATPYDDTAIKNDIATDKTEITALKTNVANNKNEIDILKSNVAATNANVETKADKAELDKYREKTVAIAESDLDASVQTKLNKVAAGGMQIMEYEVEGSVNGECWVVATGPGVKITKGTSIPGAGGGSILYPLKRLYIPDGVKVLSARIRFLKEEIASTNPGVAVDWDATRKDDTDNNFIPPLFQIWNDIPTARTIKWSLGSSVSYTNNHTIVFTGIGNGGATGLNTIVKLIY